MAGGTRVPVTLRPSEDPRDGVAQRHFRLDLDELRAAVTDRTRLLLINTPHNPTGTVLTREELAAIAELAVERDLLVITDEVYEHLVFDDAPSTSRSPPSRGCGSGRCRSVLRARRSRSRGGRSAG